MPIDPERLLGSDIPETCARHDARDAILYALGLGIGLDPLDPGALPWLTGAAPRILPSFATVLGYESFWVETQPTGIDVSRVLHASQGLRLHRPLSVVGEIRRKIRVVGVADKGVERGAWVAVEETIADAVSGEALAELRSTIVCRGEGGCGDAGIVPKPSPACPDRAPDGVIALATSPQQAFVYSLSGDRNPLHTDPAAARAAGFDRPILHGLASYGMACHALVTALCGGDPAGFVAMDARFTGVVFPGEALELHWWRETEALTAFRVTVPGRGAVALDRGWIELDRSLVQSS